jgi:hypothetical protein
VVYPQLAVRAPLCVESEPQYLIKGFVSFLHTPLKRLEEGLVLGADTNFDSETLTDVQLVETNILGRGEYTDEVEDKLLWVLSVQ